MTGAAPVEPATAELKSLISSAGQSLIENPPFKAPPPSRPPVNDSHVVHSFPTTSPMAAETSPAVQAPFPPLPPALDVPPTVVGVRTSESSGTGANAAPKDRRGTEKEPCQQVSDEKAQMQEHLQYWQEQLRQLQEAHAAEVMATNPGLSQQPGTQETQALVDTPSSQAEIAEAATRKGLPIPDVSRTTAAPEAHTGAQPPQYDQYMQHAQVHHLQNFHHLQQLAQQEQSPEIQAHIQAYMHAYSRLWQEQLVAPVAPQSVDPEYLLNVFDDFLLRSIAPSEPMSSLISTANVLYAFDKHIDGDEGRRSRDRRKSRSPYSTRRESRRDSPHGSARRGGRRSYGERRERRRSDSEHRKRRHRSEDRRGDRYRDRERDRRRRDDEQRERRTSPLQKVGENGLRKDREERKPACVRGSVAKCMGSHPDREVFTEKSRGAGAPVDGNELGFANEEHQRINGKTEVRAEWTEWDESRLQLMEQGAMMLEDKESERLLVRRLRRRRHKDETSSRRMMQGRRRRRDRLRIDDVSGYRRLPRDRRQHRRRRGVKPRGSVADAIISAVSNTNPDGILAEAEASDLASASIVANPNATEPVVPPSQQSQVDSSVAPSGTDEPAMLEGQPTSVNQHDDIPIEHSSGHGVQDTVEQATDLSRLLPAFARQMASCKPGSAAAKAAAAALRAAKEPRGSPGATDGAEPFEEEILANPPGGTSSIAEPMPSQQNDSQDAGHVPIRRTPAPPQLPPPAHLLGLRLTPRPPAEPPPPSLFEQHAKSPLAPNVSCGNVCDAVKHGEDHDEYTSYSSYDWRSSDDYDSERSGDSGSHDDVGHSRGGVWRRPTEDKRSSATYRSHSRPWGNKVTDARGVIRRPAGQGLSRAPIGAPGRREYAVGGMSRYVVGREKAASMNQKSVGEKLDEDSSNLPPWRVGKQRYSLWSGRRIQLPTSVEQDQNGQAQEKDKDDLEPIEQEEEYEVCVHRSEGSRLGVHLKNQTSPSGSALVVESVSDDENGLIPAWNSSHPKSLIQVGDRIVSVNGISGEAKDLLCECSMYGELKLVLSRISVRRAQTVRSDVAPAIDSNESEKTKQNEDDPLEPLPLPHVGPLVHGAWPGPIARPFEEEQVASTSQPSATRSEAYRKRVASRAVATIAGGDPLAGLGATLGRRPRVPGAPGWAAEAERNFQRAHAKWRQLGGTTSETLTEQGTELVDDGQECPQDTEEVKRIPKSWQQHLAMVSGTSAGGGARLTRPPMVEEIAAEEQAGVVIERPVPEELIDSTKAEPAIEENIESGGTVGFDQWPAEFRPRSAFRKPEQWSSLKIPSMVRLPEPLPVEASVVQAAKEGGAKEKPMTGKVEVGSKEDKLIAAGLSSEKPNEALDDASSQIVPSAAPKQDVKESQDVPLKGNACEEPVINNLAAAEIADKSDGSINKEEIVKKEEVAALANEKSETAKEAAALAVNEHYAKPDGRVRLRIFDKDEEIEGFAMDQACIIFGATLRAAHIADGTHATVKTQHAAIVFWPPDDFSVQALNGDVKLTGAAAHKKIASVLLREGRTAPREAPDSKILRVGSRPEPLTRQRCVFQLGESQMLFLLDILPTKAAVRALGTSRHLLHAFIDGRAFLFGKKRRQANADEDEKDTSQQNKEPQPETLMSTGTQSGAPHSDSFPSSGLKTSLPQSSERFGAASNPFPRPSQIFPHKQVYRQQSRSPSPNRGNHSRLNAWSGDHHLPGNAWTHARPLWSRRSPQRGRSPSVWRHDKVQSIPRSPGQTRQRELSSSDGSLPARCSRCEKAPRHSKSKGRKKSRRTTQDRYRSRGGQEVEEGKSGTKSRSRSRGGRRKSGTARSSAQLHRSRERRRGSSVSASRASRASRACSPSPLKASRRLKATEARKDSRKRKRRRKQAKQSSDERFEREAKPHEDSPNHEVVKEEASDATVLDDKHEKLETVDSEKVEEKEAAVGTDLKEEVDANKSEAKETHRDDRGIPKEEHEGSDQENAYFVKLSKLVKPRSDCDDMDDIRESRSRENEKRKKKKRRKRRLGYGYGSVTEEANPKEKKRKKVKKKRKKDKKSRTKDERCEVAQESDEKSREFDEDHESAADTAITAKESEDQRDDADITEMEQESQEGPAACDESAGGSEEEVAVAVEDDAEVDEESEDEGEKASPSSELRVSGGALDAESEAAHSIASSHSRSPPQERPKDYAPWVSGDRIPNLPKPSDTIDRKDAKVPKKGNSGSAQLNNLMQTVASAFRGRLQQQHPSDDRELARDQLVSFRIAEAKSGAGHKSAPKDLRIRHGTGGPVVVLDD